MNKFFICRDAEGAAAIQQVLSGDNFLEKERRLSEMILQLQMVREQLLSQQQQQQEHNKVTRRLIQFCFQFLILCGQITFLNVARIVTQLP